MRAPDFTTDWASSRDYWADMFDELDLTGKPGLRFLEIGCFEGQATLWLMQQVLTHATARMVVIDPFDIVRCDITNGERFRRNLMPYLEAKKLLMLTGSSGDVLRNRRPTFGPFDFVYVDGDHRSANVLEDAVLAWRYLKPGGVMCFDDYQWDDVVLEWMKPGIAVDAFVRCYQNLIASAKRRGKDQFVVVKA